ncbi:hypothetical protein ACP70R_023097 [Stipagrostis hirtigluma subsp. patula]
MCKSGSGIISSSKTQFLASLENDGETGPSSFFSNATWKTGVRRIPSERLLGGKKVFLARVFGASGTGQSVGPV